MVVLTAGAAHAGIRVVQDATPGGDGATWATALGDLQQAIDLAAARAAIGMPEPVWLASGVYVPGQTPSDTFVLADGVEILGGFAGHEASAVQRDPTANPTILSGELLPGVPGGPRAHHVVTFLSPPSASRPSAILDGLIIRGGDARNDADNDSGGGLTARFADLVIRGCVFEDNAAEDGGAIRSANGVLIIESCLFSGNSAAGVGGAIDSESELRIIGSRFEANDASFGGGVSAASDSIEIANTVFAGNTASFGGGLYTPSGDIRLLDVVAIDNSAASGGFAYLSTDAHAVNLRVLRNTASDGGALYVDGEVSIANLELVRNLAFSRGGGVFVAGGSLELHHPTLLDNRALTFGGAAWVNAGGLLVANGIIAENEDGLGTGDTSQIAKSGFASVTVDESLITGFAGGLAGSGSFAGTPVFANKRGPDGVLGTIDDDLTPAEGSVAVDAAGAALPTDVLDLDDDGNTAEPLPLDANGAPRALDDELVPDRVGLVADLGAREYVPGCLADLDGDGSVGTADLLGILAEFGRSVPPGSAGDFDRDGFVGTQDLLLLLSRWGTVCDASF